MNRQALLRIDILNVIMRFMVLFTMVSTVLLTFTQGDQYIWKSLILLQASVLSFTIRKITSHISSFIVLHLVLLAVYYMITEEPILRAVYMIYIIIFAITEFALDVKGKVNNTSLAFSVIFIGMYAICEYAYSEERILRIFFFYFAVIFGLLYIMNKYFINFYLYFTKHEDKVNIPLKQIKSSNTYYMIGFLYLSLMAMLLFSRIPSGGLLRFLGNLIVRFLRFVLSGLARKPQVDEEIIQEEPEENPYAYPYGEMAPPQPSEFWIAVSKIIITTCMVLVCALVAALIVYGFYGLYRMYHTKKAPQVTDKPESEATFLKTDLAIGGIGGFNALRRRLMNLLGGSNNDKIRKHYVKAIQKNTDPNKTLKYKTPEELSKYAVESSEPQSDLQLQKQKETAITSIYEKARYSNTECSKEEVQTVKELLKG